MKKALILSVLIFGLPLAQAVLLEPVIEGKVMSFDSKHITMADGSRVTTVPRATVAEVNLKVGQTVKAKLNSGTYKQVQKQFKTNYELKNK